MESDEEAVAPEEQAKDEAKKHRINDPLTTDAESPRMTWQPQRPSPEANQGDGDEDGGGAESGD